MNRSSQVLVAVAVAIVAAVAGMLLARTMEPAGGTGPALVAGTWLEPGRALPEFSLADQDSTAFGRDRLAGRWNVLFFGFTSCPDICPATLAQLATLSRSLADLPASEQPQVVFVSVDPARDSPDRVGAYVRHYDPSFTGLTGTADEVRAFTEAMHVPYAITRLDDGNYTVDHSSALFLVGPDASLRAVFSAPHDMSQLATDYRTIVGAHPAAL